MAYKGAMSSQTSIHSHQHNSQREGATPKATIPATVKRKDAEQSSSSCTPVHEQSMTTIDSRLKDPPPPARATFLASFCRAIGWDYPPQRLHDLNTPPTELCDTSTVNLPEKETRSKPSSSKQEKSIAKAKSPQTSVPSLCYGKESHKGHIKRHYSLRARLKDIWKTASPNTEKCVSCNRDIQTTRIIVAPCQHKYCSKCISKMTTHVMKDKSLFPVQCCGQELPLKQVTSTPGIREKRLYFQRREEHGVPPSERWYCPKTSCARFIHPRNLSSSDQSKQLKCPFCRVQICWNCRDLAHEARRCTVDENLNDILLFARRKHWQRCFRCHALVEKVGGCTHMRCVCKAEFCYVCGDPYPCTCRGTEVAYDGIQLEEYGDLDVNTVVAAMERAERDDD